MKRRMYFLLPDLNTTRTVHNELLLAKIPEKHMHVISKEDSLPEDLPQANLLQKSDIIHSIQTGIPLGGLFGMILGGLSIYFGWISPGYEGIVMLATAITGAIVGTWSSTMIAVSVPNSRHKAFEKEIDRGWLLYIVDVPVEKVDEISKLVSRHHPEADMRGIEPNIPVFP